MKAIKYFSSLLLIGAMLFNSCMNETPDFGQEGEGQEKAEGKVSFAAIKVDVNVPAATRGEVINTDNYIIRIYSAKTNLQVCEYPKLSEIPEIITLETGEYRIEALSHSVQPAEWDKPYYKGTQTFSIKKDEVTIIETIKCTFQNIMVTVSYSNDLKPLLLGDQTITVSLGETKMTFNSTETRVAYFAAVETSNTLIAQFEGTVDGEFTQMTKSVTGVRGGDLKNIEFSLDMPSIGDMALSLKLNASWKDINLSLPVNPGDDAILPEDPSVTPPPSSGPTVTGDGFNIADGIELVDGETKTVIVNIKADNGIQNLKVEIDSNTLTPEELQGVGLTSSFDLCYPGEIEDKLKGFGFPTGTEVIGEQSLVFNLTQFTGLLGLLGSGTHNFILTVVDLAGSTKTVTLTMVTKVNK